MPVIRGTKPTRAVLIALKRRMKVAKTGHSLLKMKRDGLMIEFFEVLSKAKMVRKELVEALLVAEHRLQMAMAVVGTVAINSVAYSLQKEPTIQLESRNIMGVVVPKIAADAVQKKMFERGYGIIGTSAAIDESADAYEKLLDKIILAAEVETAMIRLVEDIDSTKRRVNALEFKVIPDVTHRATRVRNQPEQGIGVEQVAVRHGSSRSTFSAGRSGTSGRSRSSGSQDAGNRVSDGRASAR